MKVRFDERLSSILIQFSFSNQMLIPSTLAQMPNETIDGHFDRKNAVNGQVIITPTEKCDIRNLLSDLNAAGFYLDKAGWQNRVDTKNHGRYFMVRFTFKRGEVVMQNQDAVQALIDFCGSAFWRVRGYVNPVFEDGMQVDRCAASFNFELRVPNQDAQGNPLLEWRRDSEGHRIGDGPVEKQASYTLRIRPTSVQLVAN